MIQEPCPECCYVLARPCRKHLHLVANCRGSEMPGEEPRAQRVDRPATRLTHEETKRRQFWATVTYCARCHHDHAEIHFQPFHHRPDAGFTHWGTCPITCEPILMTITSDKAA